MTLADCGSKDVKGEGNSIFEKEMELKLSHVWKPSHDQETTVVQEFIKNVKNQRIGKSTLLLILDLRLAAADRQCDVANTGAVDIGFSVNSYTPNQFLLTSVTELPFTGKMEKKMPKFYGSY